MSSYSSASSLSMNPPPDQAGPATAAEEEQAQRADAAAYLASYKVPEPGDHTVLEARPGVNSGTPAFDIDGSEYPSNSEDASDNEQCWVEREQKCMAKAALRTKADEIQRAAVSKAFSDRGLETGAVVNVDYGVETGDFATDSGNEKSYVNVEDHDGIKIDDILDDDMNCVDGHDGVQIGAAADYYKGLVEEHDGADYYYKRYVVKNDGMESSDVEDYGDRVGENDGSEVYAGQVQPAAGTGLSSGGRIKDLENINGVNNLKDIEDPNNFKMYLEEEVDKADGYRGTPQTPDFYHGEIAPTDTAIYIPADADLVYENLENSFLGNDSLTKAFDQVGLVNSEDVDVNFDVEALDVTQNDTAMATAGDIDGIIEEGEEYFRGLTPDFDLAGFDIRETLGFLEDEGIIDTTSPPSAISPPSSPRSTSPKTLQFESVEAPEVVLKSEALVVTPFNTGSSEEVHIDTESKLPGGESVLDALYDDGVEAGVDLVFSSSAGGPSALTFQPNREMLEEAREEVEGSRKDTIFLRPGSVAETWRGPRASAQPAALNSAQKDFITGIVFGIILSNIMLAINAVYRYIQLLPPDYNARQGLKSVVDMLSTGFEKYGLKYGFKELVFCTVVSTVMTPISRGVVLNAGCSGLSLLCTVLPILTTLWNSARIRRMVKMIKIAVFLAMFVFGMFFSSWTAPVRPSTFGTLPAPLPTKICPVPVVLQETAALLIQSSTTTTWDVEGVPVLLFSSTPIVRQIRTTSALLAPMPFYQPTTPPTPPLPTLAVPPHSSGSTTALPAPTLISEGVEAAPTPEQIASPEEDDPPLNKPSFRKKARQLGIILAAASIGAAAGFLVPEKSL